jgi:two-component system, chemotaxis family, chemotaxis protein CheY
MDIQSQTGAAENLPAKNYHEISSWLKTLRSGSEKKERAETTQQLILVIDDKPMRQFYTSIFLQRLKYHVITTKTAEDALTFLALSVPLAIIADVDLPDMNGVDFLKNLRQKKRTQHVPFIIYTSHKDPRIEQCCKDAGCNAYLTHAAPLDELYVALQKVTEAKPRRYVRLATYLDVIVGDSLPSDLHGRRDYITAISEKGMFVKTSSPLVYGSVLPFTFFLPTAPGWVFRIEGEVLYSHLGNGKKQPGIGVKFLKIGTTEQDLVRDFIKGTLLEGIAIE